MIALVRAGLLEDLIHSDRTVQEDRPRLVAVDPLGDRRAGVPAPVGFRRTPLSDNTETTLYRSSRGVQSFASSPASETMRRKARRTLCASSGVPSEVVKTRFVVAIEHQPGHGHAAGAYQGAAAPRRTGSAWRGCGVTSLSWCRRRPGRSATPVPMLESAVGVRSGIEVHPIPCQRSKLLRPRSGAKRQHDLGVQPVVVSRRQDGLGLFEAERLR